MKVSGMTDDVREYIETVFPEGVSITIPGIKKNELVFSLSKNLFRIAV